MTPRLSLGLLLVAGLFAFAVPRVEAQTADALLSQGRERYLEADFGAAADLFGRTLVSPTASRSVVVEAARYLATVEGIQGRMGACEELAAVATSLSSRVTPAEGAPAAVLAAFDAAREHARTAAAITWRVTDGATERGVSAHVAASLGPLASSVRVHVVCGEEAADATGVDASVTVHGEAAQHCEAQAALASGDVLYRAELPLPGLHPAAVPAPSVAGGDDTALITGLTIGGLVLLALAIAIPVGVLTSSTEGHPTMVVLELR